MKETVRRLVLELVEERFGTSDAATLTDEIPIISSDLLDSLGFIDLITRIEERTGKDVDLLELDPEDLMTINGISAYLEAR